MRRAFCIALCMLGALFQAGCSAPCGGNFTFRGSVIFYVVDAATGCPIPTPTFVVDGRTLPSTSATCTIMNYPAGCTGCYQYETFVTPSQSHTFTVSAAGYVPS